MYLRNLSVTTTRGSPKRAISRVRNGRFGGPRRGIQKSGERQLWADCRSTPEGGKCEFAASQRVLDYSAKADLQTGIFDFS